MEYLDSNLKNEIRKAYRLNNMDFKFDLNCFVETAKNILPELSYDECCRIAREYASYERESVPYTSDAFLCLCKHMVETLNPRKVLVPFADGSETSIFTNCAKVDYMFHDKVQEELVKKYNSIKSIEKPLGDELYDIILSDLPVGQISISQYEMIVEESVDHLMEDGYAVFSFPKVVTGAKGRKWLLSLREKGLFCNAILDMPINSYGFITPFDSVIAVFSLKKTVNLFVASLAEPSVVDKVVDNFVSGKPSSANPKLGVYVEEPIFSYSQYYEAVRIQNKQKSLSNAYNGPVIKLNELGTVYAPNKNKQFKKNTTSVYVPKLGNSAVVASVDEFHIKPQNYFQIVIDENKILQRFLVFYLNTEDGLKMRQMHYTGNTIKAFNIQTLGNMVVPCPSIEMQSEYLATYERLEKLRTEIESLELRFEKKPVSYKSIRTDMKDINNYGDKFSQWIESLPYPIATILKRYSVSDDMTKRQETLFYFFEAYAIFESTILSAALDKSVIDCSSLKDVDPSFFEKASLGNWVRMNRALSNLYLKLFNSDDTRKNVVLSCFHTEDDNVVRYLCNKSVCNVLEQANDKRNLWKGHGGISSELIYKEHVDALDSLLRELQRSIKDLYEKIRLIRPLGLSYSDGLFNNKVEVLTGSNPIFKKDKVISLKPLDEKKLYLQIVDTGETLELPPYFILKNSPADVKNACYFYNRVEGGNTRYVSYHYDGKPEDTENGEVAFDMIKRLLST